MPGASEFVPLALYLRPRAPKPAAQSAPIPTTPSPPPEDLAEALAAARRFHAGLRDAIDAGVSQILQTVAREVLARELELAPPDVAAIAGAAVERVGRDTLLSIRAHPDDLVALRPFEFELIGDRRLGRGDIELELRSGTIDLSLSARLETALALWSP